VTLLPRPETATHARLAVAIGLGVISILGGLLLAAADAIRGSVTWAHHSPASAAPLFLIAAAIAAVSIARPPEGRHGLLRLVAILAFTAWGTAQLMPNPGGGGRAQRRGHLALRHRRRLRSDSRGTSHPGPLQANRPGRPATIRPSAARPSQAIAGPHAGSLSSVMLRRTHAAVRVRGSRTTLTGTRYLCQGLGCSCSAAIFLIAASPT